MTPPDRLREEAVQVLAAALTWNWPQHIEGSVSMPASAADRTWMVMEPAIGGPPESLAVVILDALTPEGKAALAAFLAPPAQQWAREPDGSWVPVAPREPEAASPDLALDVECPCGHEDDEHVHYCSHELDSGSCPCAAEYARLGPSDPPESLDRHRLAALILASLDIHWAGKVVPSDPSDLAYLVADDVLAAENRP